MKSWIETLEARTLLSAAAYPVLANDAAVLADNMHLSNDKARLTTDTASFKALIAADKTNLSRTVTQDKNAVHAAQVAVKADANSPTLLAPAQATLENAMVTLSGDTAALKTRISVDSANQRTTLQADGSSIRIDQVLLKIDTQAAGVALRNSTIRIMADLAAMEAGGAASSGAIGTAQGDLNAAARGLSKPAPSNVTVLANDLGTALVGGSLTAKQQTALAQDLIDIVNSEGAGSAQTQAVVAGIQTLLDAGGVSPANTQACIAAVEALVGT